tara:strand:+ start:435 stop:1211 length:777 start_codon:yes stop_codon:yes gene_type:complete
MAFKIPNFSKQMGGSPFHNTGFDPSGQYADKAAGYPYYKKLASKRNELLGQGLSSHEVQKHEDFIAIQENKNNIIMDGYNARYSPGGDRYDPASNPVDGDGGGFTPSGPYADSWNNNFKTENGQRVGKYHTYSDDEEGFANYVNAAQAWNADQQNNNVEVLDTDPVNVEEEVEPIENVVNPNAHVPSEGIQVLSGKQRRAAKRVARLRNKAAKRGGLTEGQSKRLNRNIDKAQGDEVAYADRTKLGQVLNKPNEEEIV